MGQGSFVLLHLRCSTAPPCTQIATLRSVHSIGNCVTLPRAPYCTEIGTLLHFSVAWKFNRGFARRSTHFRAHDFATSLGFHLYNAVWRKTTKNAWTFDLLHERIWNFNRVCVLIFLSLSCHLLYFSIPACRNWKPTWRSRVRLLAKFASNDVTSKPPINFN